jgi:hypothetical protein
MGTTFFSCTHTGGRIGRIAWSNGDENFWGYFRWDRWWPHQLPTASQISKNVAAIQQAGTVMAQTLRPAVQNATKAFADFMEKAAQEAARSTPHT